VDSCRLNLKEIARLPQSRAEWWVQSTFKVLPTDQRYKDLTDEQIGTMQEHYLLDHPELAKKAEVYADPGYEDAEKTLTVDDRAAKARAEPELAPVEIED
jgi:hypothetical protein